MDFIRTTVASLKRITNESTDNAKEFWVDIRGESKEFFDAVRPPVGLILQKTVKHYLILASLLAFLFSVICYNKTTTYFEPWKINFFDYATVTDLYVITFRIGTVRDVLQSVVFTITFASLFAFMCVVVWAGITSHYDPHKPPPKTRLPMIILMLVAIVPFSLGVIKKELPMLSPDNISGSPRVNVQLRFDDTMECVSIIAGVSDYLFVWNHDTKNTSVLSRANITKIEYTVEQQPDFIHLITRDSSGRPTRKRTRERSPENQKDLNDWKVKLSQVCNQTVKP